MSIYALYRLCIWLPVLIPASLIGVVNAFGVRSMAGLGGEVVAYSLIYGGVPYCLLAVWASWWVGGRPESEIRRLMFRAPLLMVATFVPLALVVGVVGGAIHQFAAVALLGAVVIIPLGYAYVGLTLLLRSQFGPRAV